MMKLDAVGLFVNDIATMVAFYRDVMEMRTDWDNTPNAELFSGEMRLIMFPRDAFEQMTGQPYTYPSGRNGTLELSFGLSHPNEVDNAYARLVERGAAAVFAPTDMPWGQRTSYVADPEGNLIEVSAFYPA